MPDIIKVEYVNEVHMKVTADPSIRQELYEYFSFRPEGYQFVPSYKTRQWDGYLRLYTPFKPFLYVGLLSYIYKFAEGRGYKLDIDDKLSQKEKIDDDYGYQLAKEINSPFVPRDYQNDYVVHALRNKRALIISPTSSGKSYIIHLIQQHYYQAFQHRTLVVVPSIGLVHQMAGDFKDYGVNPDMIHKIQGGVTKETNCPIVISTWQSLVNMDKEWFDQFDVIVGDEAHTFKAKSLTTIMEKLTGCQYRFGFTGTVSSKSKVNKLILEGLFGGYKKIISTKDLIDDGTVADFNVKAIVLNYYPQVKKDFRKRFKDVEPNQRYPTEIDFINNNHDRNIFLRNLLWSLENQNNLILFDRVEKHGVILKDIFEKEDRVLHFIHGGVKGEERERVRNLVENDPIKQHNILASYGTFSTGINLKKLDNVIFASGSKSEIKVLQSIGRSLRKGNGADKATLYDIADNLSTTKKENYTLQHFRERINIYSVENFDFKIFNVDLFKKLV